MADRINGAALGAMVAGSVLLYSGITGRSVLKSIQAVVSGKSPSTTSVDNPIIGQSSGAAGSASGTYDPGFQPTATGEGGNPTSNQALGKRLASTYGWDTGAEWDALIALWNRESGWSNTADTRQTGAGGDNSASVVFAYGIAQARPYSKMPKAGWPPDKGGQSDAGTQITWGLIYIKQQYGSPVMAEAHEQANGWY